ncbi:hypothetical protein PFISCL1PPCAC_2824, partial [Pristionchus fissidentatus]
FPLLKPYATVTRSLINNTVQATVIPVVYGVRMDPFPDPTNETAEELLICAVGEPYPLYRFVYIVVAGLIAIGGVGFNILLIALFANRSCATTPPTLYPSALAVLDTLMCVCYVAIMFIDAIVSYLRIESLYALYYSYVIPVYTLSKFVQLAIPYMLIFATLERLVWISAKRKNSDRGNRFARIGVTLVLCAVVRLPTLWALEKQEFPDCDDYFRSITTGPSTWARTEEWWEMFDFQFMTFVQTFIPFFILVTLNAYMFSHSKNMLQHRSSKIIISSLLFAVYSSRALPAHVHGAQHALTEVRSAILTMLAIVTSYLLCNSLQLVLTLLEKSDSSLLLDPENPGMSSVFHTSFGDLISFLYTFTSAVRLFIYAICNTEIRRDLRAM